MESQARVRVWGRPRGRSGTRASGDSLTHSVREDALVVAGLDDGEEPDLAATNGEDIYDGVTFERRRVEAMESAKPQKCLRIAVPVGNNEEERAQLTLQIVGGQTYTSRDALQREEMVVFELNPLLLPSPCSLKVTFWDERVISSNAFDPMTVYAALHSEDVQAMEEIRFDEEVPGDSATSEET